jgi:hypothetical protein
MTDTPHPEGQAHDPAVRHETSDANLRGAVLFAAGLLAFAVITHLGLWAMFVFLKEREDREGQSRFPLSAEERRPLDQTEFGSPETGILPQSPRLDGLIVQPSARDRAADEEKRLDTGGTDANGRAHIRIEDAMRLVAEEYRPQGRDPAPVRHDGGVPGTGGGSNSGRTLPEAKR